MKKTVKALISVLLSVLMLFSVSSVAFAQQQTDIGAEMDRISDYLGEYFSENPLFTEEQQEKMGWGFLIIILLILPYYPLFMLLEKIGVDV